MMNWWSFPSRFSRNSEANADNDTNSSDIDRSDIDSSDTNSSDTDECMEFVINPPRLSVPRLYKGLSY